MNLTSFPIENRNCKVVNFGIREYERQARVQRKYERDNATQAYLQRKGERDDANTLIVSIAAVWAEVVKILSPIVTLERS